MLMRRGNKHDYQHNKTEFGATYTTAGRIKHVTVNCGGYVLQAPVKLLPATRSDLSGLRSPMVRGGYNVHALPGGGECLGSAAEW
jgi:hypothetical protein